MSTHLPWWYCPPKEPLTACPVRPVGFVPFTEYDAEFTYPRTSSREVMEVQTVAEDCGACTPNVLVPPVVVPEPAPELLGEIGNATLNRAGGEGLMTIVLPSTFKHFAGAACSDITIASIDSLSSGALYEGTFPVGAANCEYFRLFDPNTALYVSPITLTSVDAVTRTIYTGQTIWAAEWPELFMLITGTDGLQYTVRIQTESLTYADVAI